MGRRVSTAAVTCGFQRQSDVSCQCYGGCEACENAPSNPLEIEDSSILLDGSLIRVKSRTLTG